MTFQQRAVMALALLAAIAAATFGCYLIVDTVRDAIHLIGDL